MYIVNITIYILSFFRFFLILNGLISSQIANGAASNITSIYVNNVYDNYSSNAIYCDINKTEITSHLIGGLCNIRSAWDACNSLSLNSYEDTNKCQIILPEKQDISFTTSLNNLFLQSTSNIEIFGRNSSILQVGRRTYSTLNRKILDFYAKNLKSTSSATVNYVEKCFTACSNETLLITGCSNFTGDTFFRLYENAAEVASNDDFCGAGSRILFKPSGDKCTKYCLRVGCY